MGEMEQIMHTQRQDLTVARDRLQEAEQRATRAEETAGLTGTDTLLRQQLEFQKKIVGFLPNSMAEIVQ